MSTSTLLSRPQPHTLAWADRSHADRADLESCVTRVYGRAYGARITHFHDLLVGARSEGGELLGVIGASAAPVGPMFLEAYTGRPIERCLRERTGRFVSRREIVEVGNLAVRHPGTARWLVTSLAEHLDARGHRWVVLTGTARVRHILSKLGADLLDLGAAPGEAMGDDLPSWGSYYDNDPRVVALDLRAFCAGFSRDASLVGRMRRIWQRARRAAAVPRPALGAA